MSSIKLVVILLEKERNDSKNPGDPSNLEDSRHDLRQPKMLISAKAVFICLEFTNLRSSCPEFTRYMRGLQNVHAPETDINVKDKPMDNMHKTPLPKGFLVWNSNCQMYALDAFEANYTIDVEAPICYTKDQLVTKIYDEDLGFYILHTNTELKAQYLDMNDTIQCCYKEVQRVAERKNRILDCVHFSENFGVPNHIDYMLIECRGIQNTTVIYEDGISLVQKRQIPPSLDGKAHAQKSPEYEYQHKPFGVLMFGIDSLSQFNFRRTMPKTFQYIHTHGWMELSGYNKVFMYK
ncbi:uncharacterized protein LOC142235988 [Haematobia irritans]|uniref:uncharacterized protein LOC142235988 n=1 Tax=Haematobia irritans TaxID=7368 RepID=UPI003F500C52